jgi:hypothetical protein
VTLSDRYELLAGAVSYRELAAGAVPWLVPALTATEPARARLRAWAEAGGLTRAPDVNLELAYLGDPAGRPIVVRTLAQIAPPARDRVLAGDWVLGIGRTWRGCVTTAPAFPPPDQSEALQLIVVTVALPDEELQALIAHEVAHHWLEPGCSPSVAAMPTAERVERRETVLRYAAEWGHLDDVVLEPELARERQAASLAGAWGFTGSAADVGTCAHHLRAAILGQVAALTTSRNGGPP